ncbi:MAG TPA: SPW repeat protein [Nocardioidaceae bacterium]|nr:SPW repeat protein [Nocardioidaceae bacterium]
MRKWTRWQDWVALVAGVYGFLSPLWTDTTSEATWTMVVLGVITALVSLYSLAMPGDVISEGAHVVLGILFFISPWVMGFQDLTAMAVTAWVVGIVTFVVGLWALPESNKVHHQVAATH